MPDDLVQLQEQIGAKSGEKDHKKAIRERLKQIEDLLKFSKFRPTPKGAVNVDLSDGAGGEPESDGGTRTGARKPGNSSGSVACVLL
jgi:hypothetical protein